MSGAAVALIGQHVERAAGSDDALDPETSFRLCSLQCLLFAAGRPVTAADAARGLQIEEEEARRLLELLGEQFSPGGLQVLRVAGGYQMTTRPEFAPVIARFLEPPPQRLSHAALETLALVAYRQPVTQPEIEAVRGVKSESSIRTLLERGLIEDMGRKEVVGRPIMYRTTAAFLLYLGLDRLEDLPVLDPALGEPVEV